MMLLRSGRSRFSRLWCFSRRLSAPTPRLAIVSLAALSAFVLTPRLAVDKRGRVLPVKFVVREYLLPHQNPPAYSHDPAVAKDGSVYFADQQASYIGRLDPETGAVQEYPTPTPGSGPHGIIVAPNGQVWYTGNAKGLIGRLDPATGHITEFKTGDAGARTGAWDPHTPLLLGDKLWFTAQNSNKYGMLDPTTGEVKLYDSPIARSKPYGLQRAPDGTLWMALFGTNKLGHLDPATAHLQTVDVADSAARPRRLAITSDGRIWYTDYDRGYLGMYDPRTKTAKEWKTPSRTAQQNSNPYGIGVAPDGAIWYNEARQGNMVRFDPGTGASLVVPIPTRGSVIRNVSVDSTHGRLWIAESGVSRLGRIDLR
jgi:virginiamycin B lyase